MRRNQLGLGLGGLLVGAVIFITLAMLGIKMIPSYLEFMAVKKAVNALGAESRGGMSVVEIRRSFDSRATVDDITSVKSSDLEIAKDSSGVVISVAYRKEVPLVANVGVYIEFRAVSKE